MIMKARQAQYRRPVLSQIRQNPLLRYFLQFVTTSIRNNLRSIYNQPSCYCFTTVATSNRPKKMSSLARLSLFTPRPCTYNSTLCILRTPHIHTIYIRVTHTHQHTNTITSICDISTLHIENVNACALRHAHQQKRK